MNLTAALTGLAGGLQGYNQAREANFQDQQTRQQILQQMRDRAQEMAFRQQQAEEQRRQFDAQQTQARELADDGFLKAYPDMLQSMRGMPQEYAQSIKATWLKKHPNLRSLIFPGDSTTTGTTYRQRPDGTMETLDGTSESVPVSPLPPDEITLRANAAKVEKGKALLNELAAGRGKEMAQIAHDSVTGINQGNAAMSTMRQASRAIAWNNRVKAAAAEAGVEVDPTMLMPVPGSVSNQDDIDAVKLYQPAVSLGPAPAPVKPIYNPQFPLPLDDQQKIGTDWRTELRQRGETAFRERQLKSTEADRAESHRLTERGQNIAQQNAAANRQQQKELHDDSATKQAAVTEARNTLAARSKIQARVNELAKLRDAAADESRDAQSLLATGIDPKTNKTVTIDEAMTNSLHGRVRAAKQKYDGYQREIDQLKATPSYSGATSAASPQTYNNAVKHPDTGRFTSTKAGQGASSSKPAHYNGFEFN